MRVHEAVFVVAAIYASTQLAGGMSRRDAVKPARAAAVQHAVTEAGRAGHIAVLDRDGCARTAVGTLPCVRPAAEAPARSR